MIAMVMVGAVVAGTVFMPRTGPRPLVPTGAVLAALGLALLTSIGATTSYPTTVLPGLLVTGLGFGFIFGPTQNAATRGVTDHQTGVASALVNASQQLGGSLGTALFSSIFSTALAATVATTAQPDEEALISSYHLVFWIGAAVFLLAAALSATLFRTGPSQPPRPQKPQPNNSSNTKRPPPSAPLGAGC